MIQNTLVAYFEKILAALPVNIKRLSQKKHGNMAVAPPQQLNQHIGPAAQRHDQTFLQYLHVITHGSMGAFSGFYFLQQKKVRKNKKSC